MQEITLPAKTNTWLVNVCLKWKSLLEVRRVWSGEQHPFLWWGNGGVSGYHVRSCDPWDKGQPWLQLTWKNLGFSSSNECGSHPSASVWPITHLTNEWSGGIAADGRFFQPFVNKPWIHLFFWVCTAPWCSVFHTFSHTLSLDSFLEDKCDNIGHVLTATSHW